MRFLPDSPWGTNPSPEEIALDGWLEDSGPYVTLRDDGTRTQDSGVSAAHTAEAAELIPRH